METVGTQGDSVPSRGHGGVLKRLCQDNTAGKDEDLLRVTLYLRLGRGNEANRTAKAEPSARTDLPFQPVPAYRQENGCCRQCAGAGSGDLWVQPHPGIRAAVSLQAGQVSFYLIQTGHVLK